jgi:hypothetical protein
MKTRHSLLLAIVIGAIVAGCGVPRQAGVLAAQGAATATTLPADDAGVRQQLANQDAAWATLEQLLQQREFGGITNVDPGFVQLVDQTAALAKRQHDLIDQNQDDPAMNRQSLQQFNDLWQSANRYLNQ